MKMHKILIPVSDEIKRKLNVRREQGFTINGYVRRVLAEALSDVKLPPRRRRAA
jgi:hypothetical protein